MSELLPPPSATRRLFWPASHATDMPPHLVVRASSTPFRNPSATFLLKPSLERAVAVPGNRLEGRQTNGHGRSRAARGDRGAPPPGATHRLPGGGALPPPRRS